MQRRLVYDVAVSLDGFISGPQDDVSAFPAQGPHVDAYFERLQAYDTVIMGRATYEAGYAWGLKPGDKPYPHMKHHVVSRTLKLPAGSDIEVVRDDPAALVRRLKQDAGGDIYLCGGGAFAGAMLRAGLIDRLVLKLNPVVIGAGIPLFGSEKFEPAGKFNLIASEAYTSSVTLLTYDAA